MTKILCKHEKGQKDVKILCKFYKLLLKSPTSPVLSSNGFNGDEKKKKRQINYMKNDGKT